MSRGWRIFWFALFWVTITGWQKKIPIWNSRMVVKRGLYRPQPYVLSSVKIQETSLSNDWSKKLVYAMPLDKPINAAGVLTWVDAVDRAVLEAGEFVANTSLDTISDLFSKHYKSLLIAATKDSYTFHPLRAVAFQSILESLFSGIRNKIESAEIDLRKASSLSTQLMKSLDTIHRSVASNMNIETAEKSTIDGNARWLVWLSSQTYTMLRDELGGLYADGTHSFGSDAISDCSRVFRYSNEVLSGLSYDVVSKWVTRVSSERAVDIVQQFVFDEQDDEESQNLPNWHRHIDSESVTEFPPVMSSAWKFASSPLLLMRRLWPWLPVTSIPHFVAHGVRVDLAKRCIGVLSHISELGNNIESSPSVEVRSAVSSALTLSRLAIGACVLDWHVHNNLLRIDMFPLPKEDNYLSGNNSTEEILPPRLIYPPPSSLLKPLSDWKSALPSDLIDAVASDDEDTFPAVSITHNSPVSDNLKSLRLVSNALRLTAAKRFHALSLFNRDADEVEATDRDECFTSLAAAIIADHLLSTCKLNSNETLSPDAEIGVILVVLRELVAPREPAAASREALTLAITRIITQFVNDDATNKYSAIQFHDRLVSFENILGAATFLRDTENDSDDAHTFGFSQYVESELLRRRSNKTSSVNNKASVLDLLRTTIPWIANVLSLDEAASVAFTKSRFLAGLENSFRHALLSNDYISSPAKIQSFCRNILKFGSELGLESKELSSILREMIKDLLVELSEYATSSYRDGHKDRFENVLRKIFAISTHSLWDTLFKKLEASDNEEDSFQFVDRFVENYPNHVDTLINGVSSYVDTEVHSNTGNPPDLFHEFLSKLTDRLVDSMTSTQFSF